MCAWTHARIDSVLIFRKEAQVRIVLPELDRPGVANNAIASQSSTAIYKAAIAQSGTHTLTFFRRISDIYQRTMETLSQTRTI